MLGLNPKRVGVLEMVMGSQSVRVKALEVRIRRSLAGVDGAFRGGEGEGCAKTEAESRRVQVSSLAMVQRIGTARRRRIVARRLVGEGGECKAVGIEE